MQINPRRPAPAAFAAALSAGIIFGTAGLYVKVLQLPPLLLAAFRLVLPVLMLSCLSPAVLRDAVRSPSIPLLGASALTALRVVIWVLGFTLASLTKAVVILYTWPLFAALFAALFLKETVPRRTQLLLACAFAGILLLFLDEDLALSNRDLLGMCCMLLVAVLNAAVICIFKKQLALRRVSEIILYDNIAGAVVLLPVLVYGLATTEPWKCGLAAFYGLSIGFAACGLNYFGLSRLKASTTALLSYVEVLSAVSLGVLVLGEEITPRMLAGAVLILGSTLFVRNATQRA